MKGFELKIPPAAVFLFCVGLMWAINRLVDTWIEINVGGWLPGIFLGFGVFLGLWAVLQFFQNSTSVDPHHPDKASVLVTSGLYQFTRNPMYLAMLVILIGGFLKFGEPLNAVVIGFYVWYMNEFQIKPEEEIIEKKFGDEFRDYKSNVRRWI